MLNLGQTIPLLLVIAMFALVPTATALDSETDSTGDDVPGPDGGPEIRELVNRITSQGDGLVDDVFRLVDETTGPDDGSGGGGDEGGGGHDAPGDGVANGLIGSLGTFGGIALVGALALGSLAAGGLLLTSRYLTPKEVLNKPQRAMLYGCIKGNPGVNLKQLSEDFDMKTSTVLWHIRKLEAADLVRSQKANGLRVFYPVAGGIAAKQLGLAVATLSNQNAARILDFIAVNPGIAQKHLVEKLEINAGTVRWHLRKLKDTGLMAELSQGRMCTYYATELGLKALKQAHGLSSEAKQVSEFVSEAEATRAAPS